MSNRTFISDNKGKWVGSITNDSSNRKTVSDAKGAVIGRVLDNKTYDGKGRFFGNGDQSQRLFK